VRILLEILPLRFIPFAKISKHSIQGMLYSQLKGTAYENLHLKKGFKFFTFSDIFPSNDYFPYKSKKLLVSSPDNNLIDVWYYSFKKTKYIYLSDEPFLLSNVIKFDLQVSNSFETGSPIIIYKDSRNNEFFSFKNNDDFEFFLNRLRENAIKKYKAFYNEEINLNEQIFDKFIFKKEVVVHLKKGTNNISMVGSMWKLLKKEYISKENFKFYKFILDCGLGEKNSLGFGFINPIREGN